MIRLVHGSQAGPASLWHNERMARPQKEISPHPNQGERPRFVEISANNYCNLRCAFCYGAGKPEPKEFSPEEHQRLLDELLPGADIVIPSAGSEPFLGDLERTLAAVKEYGNRLLLITSGYELTPEWTERLAPHLYRLQVSLDSHDKETYLKLRAGSNYERITENLKAAAEILSKQGLSHRLVVSAVATDENLGQLPELITTVRKWGVEVFLIQQLYGAEEKFEHLSLEKNYPSEKLKRGKEAILAAAREAMADIMLALPPVEHHDFRPNGASPVEWDPEYVGEFLSGHPEGCYQAAQWAKVAPDGAVYPCCVSPQELALGNVRDQSFAEIYSSRKWQDLREGKLPRVCHGCELRAQYRSYMED